MTRLHSLRTWCTTRGLAVTFAALVAAVATGCGGEDAGANARGVSTVPFAQRVAECRAVDATRRAPCAASLVREAKAYALAVADGGRADQARAAARLNAATALMAGPGVPAVPAFPSRATVTADPRP